MRKLFSLKSDGLFCVEAEGSVYSIFDHKSNKRRFYDHCGNPLPNYKRPHSEELDVSNSFGERDDKLQYNKYGVACADGYLADSDGNEIPGTKLNCEDSCHATDRYFTYTLLTEEQNESISRCGTAEGITLDCYDTKTKQYVLRGIPEGKLYIFCFDGEPDVIKAAALLIDRYDSVYVEETGTIVAHKDGWVTVYDYYQ